MNKFQELFEAEYKKLFSPPTFAARMIRKKLIVEGIELTDAQTERIAEIFSSLDKDGKLGQDLHLEISDDGTINVLLEKVGSANVIDLADTADEEIEKLLNHIPEIITELAITLGNQTLKTLKSDARRMSREHAAIQRSFEKRLHQKWKTPLHLMEMFLVIAEEAGSEYNHHISSTMDISRAYKFEVLRRLHARTCQVAKEVLLLMKSGFADGAHARWRTLHEISVVASLISDNDDDLAERYLLHEIVERHKSVLLYQEYCHQLSLEPLANDEIEYLQEQTKELVVRFGYEFKNEYGWASEALSNRRPTFADIERAVDLRHIRPFYKLACVNLHAGPRGILFRLGLTEDQRDKILLSGASDIGLADPGQNTIYSVMMTTASFLTHQPNLDCLVVLNILIALEQEAFSAFDKQEYKYEQGKMHSGVES